jgi:beta-glucanase (GH16 family)
MMTRAPTPRQFAPRGEPAARPHRPARRRALLPGKGNRFIVVVVVAALAGLLLLVSTPNPIQRFVSGGNGTGAEGVLNGSAQADVSGWVADSDAGTVPLTRVPISHGPVNNGTAIDIRQPAGPGRWTLALAALRKPATFFHIGRAYRMQAYVRDLNASAQSIGILLANKHFAHRPTLVSGYEGYRDSSWHLLTRTFVCTEPGSFDTSLYFELPSSRALHWQVTAASVREVTPESPQRVSGPPTKVLAFNGAAGTPPDSRVWTHETGGNGWGNRELQTYTTRTSNAHLDGQGNLVISARREDATGRDGIERGYTSARITTKGSYEVRPGSYVEASIRAPVGDGVWPAFWLVGSGLSDVGWPACGELDIIEVVGANQTVAHSALHMATQSDPGKDAPFPVMGDDGSVDLGHPLDSQPHSYGVYFDGSMVRFYIDRKEHLAFGAADAFASGRSWPFDEPQHVVLNVAVGGTGDPSDTEFPKSMIVNSISIWTGGIPF